MLGARKIASSYNTEIGHYQINRDERKKKKTVSMKTRKLLKQNSTPQISLKGLIILASSIMIYSYTILQITKSGT